MAGSTPTTVYYQVENGQNVAIKYTDADEQHRVWAKLGP